MAFIHVFVYFDCCKPVSHTCAHWHSGTHTLHRWNNNAPRRRRIVDKYRCCHKYTEVAVTMTSTTTSSLRQWPLLLTQDSEDGIDSEDIKLSIIDANMKYKYYYIIGPVYYGHRTRKLISWLIAATAASTNVSQTPYSFTIN